MARIYENREFRRRNYPGKPKVNFGKPKGALNTSTLTAERIKQKIYNALEKEIDQKLEDGESPDKILSDLSLKEKLKFFSDTAPRNVNLKESEDSVIHLVHHIPKELGQEQELIDITPVETKKRKELQKAKKERLQKVCGDEPG